MIFQTHQLSWSYDNYSRLKPFWSKKFKSRPKKRLPLSDIIVKIHRNFTKIGNLELHKKNLSTNKTCKNVTFLLSLCRQFERTHSCNSIWVYTIYKTSLLFGRNVQLVVFNITINSNGTKRSKIKDLSKYFVEFRARNKFHSCSHCIC